MQGDIKSSEYMGIIPRMVQKLFERINDSNETIEFSVKVSMVEIYMEKIRDLMDPSKVNLKIHEDKNKGIYIEDCTESFVVSEEEVFELMTNGNSNRAIGATDMNTQSSRSHAIFILTVTMTDNSDFSCKTGKLFLVDLAGSEKLSKTNAKDQTLNEAKMINKSLSTLGRVIYALTDGKSSYIPYRDSKLTRLLQDSLGGNSKTVLIITASPSSLNQEETLSTCRFGMTAKTITNNAKINKEYTVAELKLLLSKLQVELDKKDKLLLACLNLLKQSGIEVPLDITTEQKTKEEDIEEDDENIVKIEKPGFDVQIEKNKNIQLLKEQGKTAMGLETIISNLTQEREINCQLKALNEQLMSKSKDIEALKKQLEIKTLDIEAKHKEAELLKKKLDDTINELKIVKASNIAKEESRESIDIIKKRQLLLENNLKSYKDLSQSMQAKDKNLTNSPLIVAKTVVLINNEVANNSVIPEAKSQQENDEEDNDQVLVADDASPRSMQQVNSSIEDKKDDEAKANEISEAIKNERAKFLNEKLEMLRQMKEHQLRIQKLEEELISARNQVSNIQNIMKEDEGSVRQKAFDLEKRLEILTTLYHQLNNNTLSIKTQKQKLETKLNEKNALIEDYELQISKNREEISNKNALIDAFKAKLPDIAYDGRTSIIRRQQLIKKTITGGKKNRVVMQSMQFTCKN